MEYKWMPIIGGFEEENGNLIFRGATTVLQNQEVDRLGLFVCNQIFNGGTITAEIEFKERTSNRSSCDIVIFYDPQNQSTVNVGLGDESLFTIRYFADSKWTLQAIAGGQGNLRANRPYALRVERYGSMIRQSVDGVEVLRTILPFPLGQSQVGVQCLDKSDIIVRNFNVENIRPKAFVVMQFSEPYNDVYYDVIKKVCHELEIEVARIDEASGPGIIISDITREINESHLIIADITPRNPNVFYEVGYAHALSKPTILIAEKGTDLPFDVSPFRTLFYENSIGGKGRLEEGLRKHVQAIFSERGVAS
ncbi:MAG: hypothetical protein OYM47_17720 [Gemmatimonadota bacterium]|nr:hypothetical protein [Gemmatimonadota bacterium]